MPFLQLVRDYVFDDEAPPARALQNDPEGWLAALEELRDQIQADFDGDRLKRRRSMPRAGDIPPANWVEQSAVYERRQAARKRQLERLSHEIDTVRVRVQQRAHELSTGLMPIIVRAHLLLEGGAIDEAKTLLADVIAGRRRVDSNDRATA